jgi:hypothetical protein
MLNDQLQKKIDDLNQSNQELSNLIREYKNLGTTFQKENEELKSTSMKKFCFIINLLVLVLILNILKVISCSKELTSFKLELSKSKNLNQCYLNFQNKLQEEIEELKSKSN